MKDFNLKQWLIENKSGIYSKVTISEEFNVHGDETLNRSDMDDDGTIKELNPAALGVPQAVADREMQKKDDENGDWVDNASMDVVAEAKPGGYVSVADEELEVDGVPVIVSCEVSYSLDKERNLDTYRIKITELGMDKEDRGEYIPVSDPKTIAQIENRLNTDEELAKSIIDRIDFSASAYVESDIPETVGYVMKVRKPEEKPFFPGDSK